MGGSDEPMFFDLDRETGRATATTDASMRTALLTQHPMPPTAPEEIRAMLFAAVDYVALAYDQANAGREHLCGAGATRGRRPAG